MAGRVARGVVAFKAIHSVRSGLTAAASIAPPCCQRPPASTVTVNNSENTATITRASNTSASASRRRRAPSARALADAIPPPMAPAEVICINLTIGNTRAMPASASVPSFPTNQVQSGPPPPGPASPAHWARPGAARSRSRQSALRASCVCGDPDQPPRLLTACSAMTPKGGAAPPADWQIQIRGPGLKIPATTPRTLSRLMCPPFI